MQACKNGFFYVLDRKTGELISAEPFSKVTWATHVDKQTGRPVEDPAVSDYSKEPKLIWPGPMGAHTWNSMAFDPRTGLVYIPRERGAVPVHQCAGDEVRSALVEPRTHPATDARGPRRGRAGAGALQGRPGRVGPGAAESRLESALQIARQRWRARHRGQPRVPGHRGWPLVAYSADKGEKLWEANAQTGLVAAPISYMVDGEQYIAIAAGWGGGFPRFMGEIAAQNRMTTKSRMLVYKIGGNESLPPMPAARPVPAPPALEATKEQVDQGRTLYTQYCSFCHGGGAISGGSVPDLRHMDADAPVFCRHRAGRYA